VGIEGRIIKRQANLGCLESELRVLLLLIEVGSSGRSESGQIWDLENGNVCVCVGVYVH
jgi:hypothetical protein